MSQIGNAASRPRGRARKQDKLLFKELLRCILHSHFHSAESRMLRNTTHHHPGSSRAINPVPTNLGTKLLDCRDTIQNQIPPASMAPRVYKSSLPSVPIVASSVYTHLFSTKETNRNPGRNLVGSFPGSSPAFIDAISGTTITRSDLKRLTLAFGYGIRNHPQIAAKRGDTVLIYSLNSLCWPVVLLGLGKQFLARLDSP